MTINGHTKDVNLGVGSKKVNRVIVWNSGYLNTSMSYMVTVKVVSSR